MHTRLALSLSLVLLGCGDDDGGSGTTTTMGTTGATTAPSSSNTSDDTDPTTTTGTTEDPTTSGSATETSGTAGTGMTTGETSGTTDDSTTTGTTGGEIEPAYTCPPGLDPCPAFPGASWDVRDPAQLGLDAGVLDNFAAATGGGRGCVFRYGYAATCWGNPAEGFEWASASKTVWSTFLLFAVAEGRLADVDALIADWDWPLAPEDQTMTFRHLANQVSGYALPEAPGAAWGYNDFAIKLYARTLFERVFAGEGDPNQVAANPGRFGPLTFEDGPFFTMIKGAPRVGTSPRDFARFGWLWANYGRWGETSLIPASLIQMALEPGVPGNLPRTAGGAANDYLNVGTAGGGVDQTPLGPGVYAFNWWLNPGGATWPSAPEDTFQANGHWNGEVLTVIPSLGIVAAWKGKSGDDANFNVAMDGLLGTLVAAVIE